MVNVILFKTMILFNNKKVPILPNKIFEVQICF